MRFEYKERMMDTAPAFPETVLREPKRSATDHFSKGALNMINDERDLNLHELTMLSISPFVRRVQHWWLTRTERHYLICADVEQERAREAQMNVAYYQKQAALVRASRY